MLSFIPWSHCSFSSLHCRLIHAFCSAFFFLVLPVLFEVTVLVSLFFSKCQSMSLHSLSRGLILIIFASFLEATPRARWLTSVAHSLPARIHPLSSLAFGLLWVSVGLEQRSTRRHSWDCPEGRLALQSTFTDCTYPCWGGGRGSAESLDAEQ